MIAKKKGQEGKKIETDFHHVPELARKKQKLFERTKLINLQDDKRQQLTINPPRNYFSEDKNDKYEKKGKLQNAEEQRACHKSMYNRPFHMLRQYLHRKQRLSFIPIMNSNPERVEDMSKGYTTLNDFRIKKSKKAILFNPPNDLKTEFPGHNKISKIDQDFISFNASKNLYQMTYEELQESIKWKKHFLQMLNEKIKDSKVCSGRERNLR